MSFTKIKTTFTIDDVNKMTSSIRSFVAVMNDDNIIEQIVDIAKDKSLVVILGPAGQGKEDFLSTLMETLEKSKDLEKNDSISPT